MKIANIYPIKNQHFYKNEDYTMILAHLVKKGLYAPENFNKDSYVIMDNGLFERQQVSTSLLDCIKLAEQSGIKIDEIIIPDAVNDAKTTINLFLKNYETIIRYQHKYRFMFVAQARNYKELEFMMTFIGNYPSLNISVGISKLCPFDRASDEAIEIYKRYKLPIHLLGIKESFEELQKVKDVIRGCDTSQIAYIAKNEQQVDSIIGYHRDNSMKERDIDLEFDCLDNTKIEQFLTQFNQELF